LKRLKVCLDRAASESAFDQKGDVRKLNPQWKRTNDEVHSSVTLDPVAVAICDTPHFQRLRSLKQTGCGRDCVHQCQSFSV
jgi:hypothetical protein